MSTPPKWKRVLISGSNLEVNHLTSSTALEPFKVASVGRDIVFASSGASGDRGHFQTTGSIENIHVPADPRLRLTHARVNVPDLPISASTVGTLISSPQASPPLTSFPVVFKNEPHGGFEITSSIFYEPNLGFFTSQSTPFNSQIRSGSKAEGPDAGDGSDAAPIPFLPSPNLTNVEFAITFTGSFGFTPEDESFIDASNGDFMKFRRAVPTGQGITASFVLPMISTPNGPAYGGGGEKFKIILRKYDVGSLLTPAGDYVDQEIEISLIDPTFVPPGNPQFGDVGSTMNNGVTGSATGSFNIDGPISIGDKFQLRYKRTSNNIFFIGERPDGSGGDFDRSKFIFDGATFDPGNTLAADLSGSLQGNVQGGISSSLTGVTLNDSQGVFRGDGILLRNPNGTNNPDWNGESLTTMSVRLFPMNVNGASTGNINKSGLEVPEISDANLFSGNTVETTTTTTLALADGLPQAGLEFDAGNKYTISVDLASNSGLIFASPSGDLKIADTFLGDGITGSFGNDGTFKGSASIDLPDNSSGLTVTEGISADANKLLLSSSVAGDGLLFPLTVNDRSSLNIDTNFAVTGSGSITLRRADSNPLSVQQNYSGGNTVGSSQEVFYNNNSTTNSTGLNNAQLRISKTWTSPYTFKDDILIKGNFRVLDSSNVTSINVLDFKTTDPFILLNSGSATASPFTNDLGGILVQTSSYTQGGSGQASGSAIFANFKSVGDSIGGQAFLKTGWAVSKGNIPFDATSPIPPFNSTSDLTQKIRQSDFLATLSHVRLSGLGSTGAPGPTATNDTHYGTIFSEDNVGSWYIDTGSTGTSLGGESNVYLYGIFD